LSKYKDTFSFAFFWERLKKSCKTKKLDNDSTIKMYSFFFNYKLFGRYKKGMNINIKHFIVENIEDQNK
jgi:hypothetical protein